MMRRLLLREESGLVLLLLLLIAFFATQSPYFRTGVVVWDLLREISPFLIAAAGMGVLMLAGEFDLSVGAMAAFIGYVIIATSNATASWPLGVLAGFAAGALIGCILGVAVTRFKMNSLMTTLGMLFLLRGLSYVLTGKVSVPDEHGFEWFQALYHGSAGPVPFPVIFAALVVVSLGYALRQTPWGRSLYAVGGNAAAAGLAGIPVAKIKFTAFLTCSLTATVAAVLITAQLDAAYFEAGSALELQAITAVVLGGISLGGGQGSMLGAVLGVLILSVTSKGMRLMGIYTTWQMVATGTLLIAAVYVHGLRRKLRAFARM